MAFGGEALRAFFQSVRETVAKAFDNAGGKAGDFLSGTAQNVRASVDGIEKADGTAVDAIKAIRGDLSGDTPGDLAGSASPAAETTASGAGGPSRIARLLGGNGWHEGDPIPPPRTGDQLPADAKLQSRYEGENDPNNPQRWSAPKTVHYMTPEEQEESRIFVDADGKLRQASDGSLFDTNDATTHWSGSGRAIFVMDRSGNLYATPNQQVYYIHHSSLLAGDPVVGAGEIEARGGELVAMTDQSGHYIPTAAMNDRVLQALRDQGLRTSPGFKQYNWGGGER